MDVLTRIAIAAALVAGCYDPGTPPAGRCEVTCSTNGACPGDLACLSDNFCHQVGDEICSATDFVRREVMAGGDNHTCAIAADRTLACWGANDKGQLGADPAVLARTATPMVPDIPSHAHWVTIAAGTATTCGVDTDGAMLCWGDASAGGLPVAGGGTVAPTVIDPPGGGAWQAVALGPEHGCAILRPADAPGEFGGDLYCWGTGGTGVTGMSAQMLTAPTRVDLAAIAAIHDWIDVGVGDAPPDPHISGAPFHHTCARRQGGTVWCFGGGTVAGRPAGMADNFDEAIVQSGEYARLSVGDVNACATTLAGEVYCWGTTRSFNTARAERVSDALLPSSVAWTAIAIGRAHTCAASTTGQVRCFGESSFGQRGERDDQLVFGDPTPPLVTDVALDGGVPAADLALGDEHSCALVSNGWQCWGNNRHGQLGRGVFGDQYDAVEVGAGIAWRAVSAGTSLTCGIGDNGSAVQLYCWGSNDYHLLAAGMTATPRVVSTSAVPLTVGVDAKHVCYGDKNETVQCWGSNDGGQLGRDGVYALDAPMPVVDGAGATLLLHAVVSASDFSSSSSSCAIETDGTAVCWGSLSQTHHPATTSPIITLATGDTLALGPRAACAIVSGALQCWGSFRAPGEMFAASHPTPVTIALPSTILAAAPPPTRAVAIGQDHICAHHAGLVQCWGANDLGQSALDPGPDVLDPTTIPFDMPQAVLAAGLYYTCVGGTSGIVLGPPVCWGQVGGLALRPPSLPAGGSNGMSISALHGCEIAGNGTQLFCWGRNDNNQLGAGLGYDPHPASVVAP